MHDVDFVVIVDVCYQMVGTQNQTLQKIFYCKKFDGTKEDSIKIPAKHPSLISIYKIAPSAKKLTHESLICNQRKPSRDEGMK